LGDDGDDFIFRKFDHDDAIRRHGRTGNFDGDDIIDMILLHPACAPYIAQKLWTFLPTKIRAGARAGAGRIAARSKYELRPLLRTMLQSQAFYSPRAVGTQIKSPVQLIAGTVKLLGLKAPEARVVFGPLQQMDKSADAAECERLARRTNVDQHQHAVRAVHTCVMLAGGVGQIAAATGRASGAKILKVSAGLTAQSIHPRSGAIAGLGIRRSGDPPERKPLEDFRSRGAPGGGGDLPTSAGEHQHVLYRTNSVLVLIHIRPPGQPFTFAASADLSHLLKRAEHHTRFGRFQS